MYPITERERERDMSRSKNIFSQAIQDSRYTHLKLCYLIVVYIFTS
jgi:hypothetical protein